MFTSPRKGSGRLTTRSPQKNDSIDLPTAKLRSPVKRTMRELNQLAYENAMKHSPILSETNDAIGENELTIINEIIRLSKTDGLRPLDMAIEDDDENESEEDNRKVESPKKTSPRKSESIKKSSAYSEIFSRMKNEETDAILNDGKITTENNDEDDDFTDLINNDKPETFKRSLQNSLADTISDTKPDLKYQFSERSPFTTPVKSEKDDIFLPRSARKRQPPPNAEINPEELTPRTRRRKTLHSTSNGTATLKPPNFSNIKLMEVPQVDTNDDELLSTDNKKKNKVLYHDGYDAYFEQNQTRTRVSKNSMTMAPDLSYEEFNKYNKMLPLICQKPIQSLNRLYQLQYSQWLFELEEGFNLAFYGIGSKKRVLVDFLQDYLLPSDLSAKCIVVNGYNTEFTLRAFLKEVWRICFGKSIPVSREIRETSNFTQMEFMRPKYKNMRCYILLNNIDGDALRNDDLQFILSEIAKISQIRMLCSLDNLVTPVFWDAAILSSFNFIWHNISTFDDYTTEITFKDPLSIGKTDEILGSRGAKYVLSSLTGNAKSLYKLLVLQQLEKIDTLIGEDTKMLEHRGLIKGSPKSFVSLREFYELCVSEFIISNDISFRTILGEFVEHKMCTLTRDSAGVEILFISFTVDELEKLLDEELID